jgi:two-component system, chemotaxis family, chemotaxis protein CheY
MSLTGNLEDLPLLDILQIVSFSKKTGYLSIRTGAGEGAIVFRDGFVISAFTWDTAPLDPRARSLPPDQRVRMLRNRIEAALEQLIRLREGQFNFSLSDEAPTRVGARDILEETLPDGINPQELLLDLARGMDEDRRDSTAALEVSFVEPEDDTAPVPTASPPSTPAAAPGPAPRPAAPPSPPPPAPPGPSAPSAGRPSASSAVSASSSASAERVILLVDDEEEVRRVLADHFTSGGYQVVEAEDPEAAVKKAGRLGRAGIPFLVVSDLGMPTSGGSSFQGGFEVVKRLGKMNLHPPVLMMTESLGSALHARAKQMGIARIVFKPGLSKLDPGQFEADLRAFAHKLISDVVPRLAAAAEAAPAPARKMGPSAPPARTSSASSAVSASPPSASSARRSSASSAVSADSSLPSAEELSREFTVLQERLEELRRPNDASQIAMLVMKMAREFFERGVLFLVKNGEARGLGGFGPAPREESLHLLARDVLIPLSEPSVFLDVIVSHRPLVGPLPEGRWSQYLMGKIGRFRSATVALLPLLTHRETIALLFGDNPETGRPFGRLEALEVFINQAGIALENAFLQRKVHTLQAHE